MLRQQNNDTTTDWQHTPPSPVPPSTEQMRFDKDAVQAVLEAATRLQAADENTLSQSELETVAEEMGIAPHYVRQVLHETAGTHQEIRQVHPLVSRKPGSRKTELVYMPLVYGLCVCPLFATENSQQSQLFMLLHMSMVLVVPFLLSLVAGFRLRQHKWAAMAGVLNIVALVVGMFAGLRMNPQIAANFSGRELIVFFWMILGAVACALVGAMGGQWWEARNKVARQPAQRSEVARIDR